jgi:DNA ligase (NAD+)
MNMNPNLQKKYNEEFINILGELNDVMLAQGEVFRARSYKNAQETIMRFKDGITDPDQLKGLKGIGDTIFKKLIEYKETGKILTLENAKKNPIILLTQVYGIGPKKARQLIENGITSIEHLRERPEYLNDVQKIGLKYYEHILEKIPRNEIMDYENIFSKIMNDLPDGNHNNQTCKFEIVGSYRRGKMESGDIDVIITHSTNKMYNQLINTLIEHNIILHVLSRGESKCLTLSRIPNRPGKVRRIDFLYSPPHEYPFAILYFTGSKSFNTVMRTKALEKGYTLNEHGISLKENGVKGELVNNIEFKDEESIFDFLGMKYKTPQERIDGTCVEDNHSQCQSQYSSKEDCSKMNIKDDSKGNPKNKTLKIKHKKRLSTKVLIERFKKLGTDYLKILSEEEMKSMLENANQSYYCDNISLMTDNQYDILREYTLTIYQNNKIARDGHKSMIMNVNDNDNQISMESIKTVEKNKVHLPYEMWSMDKIKPDTDSLNRWKQRFKCPYLVSCKLDGVSGLYVRTSVGNCNSDKVSKLYTRGNGTIGHDISHLIPYLNLQFDDSVNNNDMNSNIAVRGEFIVSKGKFKEYSGNFSNARNFVAGIINQKHLNSELLSSFPVRFVAYELIQPVLQPSEQLEYLNQHGFEVVDYAMIGSENGNGILSNESLSHMLLKWRNECKYEIDGIICAHDKIYPRISGNPEHAFAFKMVLSEQIAEAKVVNVLWTPSKDGILKPRIQIEPIILGGVKIEYATGFNAKFIQENRIGIGAIIKLIRSGDVIPHILEVTQQCDEAVMPYGDYENYEWNENYVDIILKNKNDSHIVREKGIETFFTTIGVDGLKEGKIKKLVSSGYDTIPSILKMKQEDFEKIDGFGKKTSEKIYSSIEGKIKEVSLVKLMVATNFARGIGEKKLIPILKEIPDLLSISLSGLNTINNPDKHKKYNNEDKIKQLISIKGIAMTTARKIIENIPHFISFLKETGLECKLEEEKHINTINNKHDVNMNHLHQHPLFEKSIIMTGFRDKVLENKILELGGYCENTITKKTFMVLVKDFDETTGKTEKAKQMGIHLMLLSDFKNKYGL